MKRLVVLAMLLVAVVACAQKQITQSVAEDAASLPAPLAADPALDDLQIGDLDNFDADVQNDGLSEFDGLFQD